MKSIVIYYSYSGNTDKAARVLVECLGTDNLIRLEALDESASFLRQCRRAFFKQRARIKDVNYDLSAYDQICFGSPIWAFGPAPALLTYLDNCSGLENKQVILFTTFGSGTGKENCFRIMEKPLREKGVKQISRFSISQDKISDLDYCKKVIKETILATKKA